MLIFHMKFRDLCQYVEGALLLVDGPQGSGAPNFTNCYTAVDQGLEVIPVINKIDLSKVVSDRVKKEIEDMIGLDSDQAPLVSAKSGKRHRRSP